MNSSRISQGIVFAPIAPLAQQQAHLEEQLLAKANGATASGGPDGHLGQLMQQYAQVMAAQDPDLEAAMREEEELMCGRYEGSLQQRLDQRFGSGRKSNKRSKAGKAAGARGGVTKRRQTAEQRKAAKVAGGSAVREFLAFCTREFKGALAWKQQQRSFQFSAPLTAPGFQALVVPHGRPLGPYRVELDVAGAVAVFGESRCTAIYKQGSKRVSRVEVTYLQGEGEVFITGHWELV